MNRREGGRWPLPLGPRYSTAARFESLADLWPDEAWSLVLEFETLPNELGEHIAKIRLLVAEGAPSNLLDPGERFDLFEGSRCVAQGQVL